MLFELISARYERRSLLITANRYQGQPNADPSEGAVALLTRRRATPSRHAGVNVVDDLPKLLGEAFARQRFAAA